MLEPWFPLFARVGVATERDVLAAMPLMGIPRKTERASDFHRCWRNNFRRVCDLAEGIFTLKEEPEGIVRDYIICEIDPQNPFVLLWARTDGQRINRNRTDRNKQIQQQEFFWDLSEPDSSELPAITLAHTIEDEYTEAGRPCLWMGRLLLVRERFGTSETITEVHVYQKPDRCTQPSNEVPPPLVVAREQEDVEWQRIIRKIRKSA